MSMSNFYTEAKRPQGTEFEPVEMIDGAYGTHYYGVRFPDGEVYPEDKCEFMAEKSQLDEPINIKEATTMYMCTCGKHETYGGEVEVSGICHRSNNKPCYVIEKSPLDELIDEMRKEWTGNRVDSCLIDGCEYQIRLAVQKHAEAVQDGISLKSNVGEEFDSKFNNQIREEIQSVSDKWRGC